MGNHYLKVFQIVHINFELESGISLTNLAYKTGISFTNMHFSIYKQASRLTNWRLGLQLSIKKKTINPYVTLTEDDVHKKLEVSRQHAAEGKVRDADDVICDMRKKYGI